jgi:hypothetical protein
MQSMNENDFEYLAKARVNTPPMAKMTDDGKAEIIFRGTDNEMGPEVGFEEVWNIVPLAGRKVNVSGHIGCRQNFREAVNDRFQSSLANNAP